MAVSLVRTMNDDLDEMLKLAGGLMDELSAEEIAESIRSARHRSHEQHEAF
jgi:hypothetical protein